MVALDHLSHQGVNLSLHAAL